MRKGLQAPEGRQIVAPGEAFFASPGLEGKLGKSPEGATEQKFLSPLQGSYSISNPTGGSQKTLTPGYYLSALRA